MSVGVAQSILNINVENQASARAAGLHYVGDREPGLTRVRRGGGFVFRDARGKTMRDAGTLARIRSLAIPPAWTDVWICARSDGHVQATGRDARGRKQHRYHPEWTRVRTGDKYDRMVQFGLALPAIRRRVSADLRKPPLSRGHVVATVVKLLEKTYIRIGNQEYARLNKSFGLTTLLDEHVRIDGHTITFHFRAKSGVLQTVALTDARMARNIEKCRGIPGRALFQYLDADGRRQSVDSTDVNAYLREITGRPFTAKNFRTWAGTVHAAKAVSGLPPFTSESGFNRNVVRAVDLVAGKLGNTRAVCRKCYVHPGVFDAYRAGVTIANARQGPRRAHFSAEEAAVMALLRRRAGREGRKAA